MTPAGTSSGEDSQAPAGPAGARTSGEEVAELDREFDESLAEFDGMIQQENEVLAEKRSEAAASAASSSAGGFPSGGYASGGAGQESGGREGSRAAEREQGFLSGGDPGDSEEADASGGGNAGSGPPVKAEEGLDPELQERIPEDVGDGSDDDIVARQLREAAIAEEDPELREKLWDEYRQYKASSGAGN